ncbi:MAG: rRNA adenine N-6-methyltransferase family protein, partial [Pseudonocardiaceae bacterium]
MERDAAEAAQLRRRLAGRLAEGGQLRSRRWRAAVEAVPRHAFLPEFFRMVSTPQQTVWEPISPARVGRSTWLELTYADETWVTQLDGHTRPGDVDAGVPGEPTSSSTLPSLVVRMLEDLDVHDGDDVLEIGTGTGYSTALLCERLGDEHVTSVEIDTQIAADAVAALHRVGRTPTVVAGDGLAGCPSGGRFDKVVATCSMRRVPAAWIDQTVPGGTILVTIGGW